MMKHQTLFSFVSLLTLAVITFSQGVQALDIDQSSNIFKFQQKLAMNGNEQAQYKLASMYETGDGTEKDIEQAKHWFSLAAKAGYQPAVHRETYLQIKEQGYQAKDAAWLKSIQADANKHDAEAVFLLAQLYHQGLGVKKDLNKSLELLSQIKILGLANVDKEIASVKSEIEETELSSQREEEKRQLENERILQAKKEQELEQKAIKEQQAKAEQLTLAEKKRKYEEVMMKLRLEQKKINEQQAKITGGEVVTINDEF
jgi:TPR repeat protein